MTHLQGKNTGQIFTEFLWEFTVASDADLKGATYEVEEAATLEVDKKDQSTSASETVLDVRASRQGANSASKPTAESTHVDKDEERGPKRRLVPMHVFRKGDPVLLIQAREDGSLPDFQASMSSPPFSGLQFRVLTLGFRVLWLPQAGLQTAGSRHEARILLCRSIQT